jgi:hypothetical protein
MKKLKFNLTLLLIYTLAFGVVSSDNSQQSKKQFIDNVKYISHSMGQQQKIEPKISGNNISFSTFLSSFEIPRGLSKHYFLKTRAYLELNYLFILFCSFLL